MLVRELIELLQRQAPDATVVLWDHSTHEDPCVVRLRDKEVQPIDLGMWESNGVRIFELWNPDLKQDGPLHAVVLGAS